MSASKCLKRIPQLVCISPYAFTFTRVRMARPISATTNHRSCLKVFQQLQHRPNGGHARSEAGDADPHGRRVDVPSGIEGRDRNSSLQEPSMKRALMILLLLATASVSPLIFPIAESGRGT